MPDGQYTLLVRATDAAGNLSQNAILTFTLDTTIASPTVKLVSDTGVSTTDGLTSNDSVTGTASDLNTVSKLEAAFDTGTGSPSFHDITTKLINRSYTLTAADLTTLRGSELPDGKYKLLVRATDAAGNLSQNATLTFTLDTTIASPTVALVNDTGISKSDGVTFDPTASGTASDLNGIASLQATLDQGIAPTFHDITSHLANDQFTLNSTDLASILGSPLADGGYRLRIQSQDKAGNVATSDLFFTLDTVPPKIAVTTPIPETSLQQNITILGNVTDDGSGVASLEFALDSGTFAPIVSRQRWIIQSDHGVPARWFCRWATYHPPAGHRQCRQRVWIDGYSD